MVERARAAVRNHPLVEQGVNRLVANMRIGGRIAPVVIGYWPSSEAEVPGEVLSAGASPLVPVVPAPSPPEPLEM